VDGPPNNPLKLPFFITALVLAIALAVITAASHGWVWMVILMPVIPLSLGRFGQSVMAVTHGGSDRRSIGGGARINAIPVEPISVTSVGETSQRERAQLRALLGRRLQPPAKLEGVRLSVWAALVEVNSYSC